MSSTYESTVKLLSFRLTKIGKLSVVHEKFNVSTGPYSKNSNLSFRSDFHFIVKKVEKHFYLMIDLIQQFTCTWCFPDSLVVHYQLSSTCVSAHWICCHYSGKYNITCRSLWYCWLIHVLIKRILHVCAKMWNVFWIVEQCEWVKYFSAENANFISPSSHEHVLFVILTPMKLPHYFAF